MFTVRSKSLALSAFLAIAYTACDPSGSDAPMGPGDPSTERLTVADFRYAGAFRLPATTFGASSLNFSEGPIEVHGQSLFIVGHSHDQAIAEFQMPGLSMSETLEELNMASTPDQPFSTVLDRVGANPQGIDRISALTIVAGPTGPELLINGYEYYDAPADNSHTTLVLRDPSNLAGSDVDGFFALEGGAHAAGWMTNIPPGWQSALGGTMLAGHSSGVPIIGRLSVGPSAFLFDPVALVGQTSPPDPITTIPLLDYSLATPLAGDLSNESGTNDLWTHLSRAVFGFIAPGTGTYVTLGHSGGHGPGGVCYKCTPTGETQACGGYCAVDPQDNSLFYWLYDVADLVSVLDGTRSPHELRPYEYGPFPSPFATSEMGGGAFDGEAGLLYLTMQRADSGQGQYANPPVVVTFQIN